MIHTRSTFTTFLRDFLRAAPGAHARVVVALVLLLVLAFAAPARAQCPAG